MTEWLKLMLEEIARKQAERERASAEAQRRAGERTPTEQPAAPARPARHAKNGEP
jgi:hypothetical protein